MSAPTNTDLTEEDAADLQFPKGEPKSSNHHFYTTGSSCAIAAKSSAENDSFICLNVDTKCANCVNELSVVYIICEECDKNICTKCFANGVEFSSHKNDHSYRIFHDQFLLFENSTWTAREELALLNGLINMGNWISISRLFPNRTLKEIKEHYEYFYIHQRGSSLLPRFTQTIRGSFIEPIIPYRVKLSNITDPPRSSSGNNFLAGYNAARSDFEVEYDASAEDLICNLEVPNVNHPHYEIITNLQCSVLKMYNAKLKERMRRRRIIRKHGLIMLRRVSAWLHRYDATISQNVYEKMIKFMQFCSGQKFEYIMEGLHRAGELKMQIAR